MFKYLIKIAKILWLVMLQIYAVITGGSRGGQRGHAHHPQRLRDYHLPPPPPNAKRKSRQAPDKSEMEENQSDFDTSMT